MEYIPSEIENEFIDKIIQELMKYSNISDLEKAYYVYYRFCQFYIKNNNFYYGYDREYTEKQYLKQTEEDRKATCYQENATIAVCLNKIGINAGILKTDIQHHVDGFFSLDDENIFFYDASRDLERAKTGRIIRWFGFNFNKLRSIRSREYIEYIRNYFWNRGITVDNNMPESITEKQVEKLDKKLNLDGLGTYTNNFYKKLEEILSDEEYMRRKFKAKDKGRQLEALVDIINIHKVPNDTEFKTDYSTGSATYVKIFSLFPTDCFEIFDGYERMQNAGRERKIFFIKKEDGVTIYEFDENSSRLKKMDAKDLEKKPIYNLRRYRGFKRLTDEERSIGFFIKEINQKNSSREH